MNRQIKEKSLLYKVQTKQDTEAFAELYDLYVEPVYRFVYFKISNREEAEDLTSDIFMKVWGYLIDEKGNRVSSFRGLVYRVARNRIIDIYRERARRRECVVELSDMPVEEITDGRNPAKEAEVNYDVEQLLSTMKKLKQEYQEVIHLKHIEGLPIREISKMLDKSSASIRVTLHRAMKKLRELSDYE